MRSETQDIWASDLRVSIHANGREQVWETGSSARGKRGGCLRVPKKRDFQQVHPLVSYSCMLSLLKSLPTPTLKGEALTYFASAHPGAVADQGL